jgi:FeS assembly protein SufD
MAAYPVMIDEEKEQSLVNTFPTRKDEIWRFVNVSDLQPFENPAEEQKVSSTDSLPPYMQSSLHINGNKLEGELSENISFEIKAESKSISSSDYFTNKNLAFNSKTPTLTIAADTENDENICIHPQSDQVNWNRLHIVASEGSHSKICIHTIETLNNAVATSLEISIEVKKGASLKVGLLASSHQDSLLLQGVHASLDRDSVLDIVDLDANIKSMRTRYHIELNGENAEAKLTGTTIGDKQTQSHHYIEVYHNAPHCRSFQFFKNLLLDKAKASFDGTVNVKEGAAGTSAHQLNNNLLLSENARIYTKPRMKIKASDVKCNHGATSGSLDEDEIFYLMSRGFSRDNAVRVLALGFIREALSDCHHTNAIQWWLDNNIKRLQEIEK